MRILALCLPISRLHSAFSPSFFSSLVISSCRLNPWSDIVINNERTVSLTAAWCFYFFCNNSPYERAFVMRPFFPVLLWSEIQYAHNCLRWVALKRILICKTYFCMKWCSAKSFHQPCSVTLFLCFLAVLMFYLLHSFEVKCRGTGRKSSQMLGYLAHW